MILIIAWLICGGIGAALLHANWQWYFKYPMCPSPLQILKCCFGAVFGPLLLIVSGIVWLVDWCGRSQEKNSWWTRPICKPKN